MKAHLKFYFTVQYSLILLSFIFIASNVFGQRLNSQALDFHKTNSFKPFNYRYSYNGKTTFQTFRKYKLSASKNSFSIEARRKATTPTPFTYIDGSLKINRGGELNISNRYTLVIYGNLEVATGATLINNGNLVIKGDLIIGNSKGKRGRKDIGPQDVKFINKSNASLFVRGNLIGIHPHGVELNGAIAIDGKVGFHFHLGHNKMNKNHAFYYRENRNFSRQKKIEGGDKDIYINKLKHAPRSFVKFSNINVIREESLKKLIPYLDNDLPIELVKFDINIQKEYNILSWVTAQEINNSHFIIEQSFDNKHFKEIDRVLGQGNSNIEIEYEIEVKNSSSQKIYYRLKQVDFDGHSESWVISAVGEGIKKEFDFSIYPNPTSNSINILFDNKDFDNIQYYIINASTGKQKEVTGYKSNVSYKKIDLSSYSPGVYLVKVTSQGKEIFSKKIIKN